MIIYGFNKKDRSTFSYWFAHWCAFQMVALNCHSWKPKYLLHDWYKPWMKLFCKYETVQMYHNKHSNHHLLHWFLIPNSKVNTIDWQAMIIDWECSRFTKQASPLTAKEELNRIIKTLKEQDMSNKTVRQLVKLHCLIDTDLYNKKIEIAKTDLQLSLKILGLDG